MCLHFTQYLLRAQMPSDACSSENHKPALQCMISCLPCEKGTGGTGKGTDEALPCQARTDAGIRKHIYLTYRVP